VKVRGRGNYRNVPDAEGATTARQSYRESPKVVANRGDSLSLEGSPMGVSETMESKRLIKATRKTDNKKQPRITQKS
jgi:hypothetical protein